MWNIVNVIFYCTIKFQYLRKKTNIYNNCTYYFILFSYKIILIILTLIKILMEYSTVKKYIYIINNFICINNKTYNVQIFEILLM